MLAVVAELDDGTDAGGVLAELLEVADEELLLTLTGSLPVFATVVKASRSAALFGLMIMTMPVAQCGVQNTCNPALQPQRALSAPHARRSGPSATRARQHELAHKRRMRRTPFTSTSNVCAPGGLSNPLGTHAVMRLAACVTVCDWSANAKCTVSPAAHKRASAREGQARERTLCGQRRGRERELAVRADLHGLLRGGERCGGGEEGGGGAHAAVLGPGVRELRRPLYVRDVPSPCERK